MAVPPFTLFLSGRMEHLAACHIWSARLNSAPAEAEPSLWDSVFFLTLPFQQYQHTPTRPTSNQRAPSVYQPSVIAVAQIVRPGLEELYPSVCYTQSSEAKQTGRNRDLFVGRPTYSVASFYLLAAGRNTCARVFLRLVASFRIHESHRRAGCWSAPVANGHQIITRQRSSPLSAKLSTTDLSGVVSIFSVFCCLGCVLRVTKKATIDFEIKRKILPTDLIYCDISSVSLFVGSFLISFSVSTTPRKVELF